MKNDTKPAKTLSVFKFMQIFPDEQSAITHIERLLWNGTPTCPHLSKKHINRYVNEFTFRLNEGNCAIDIIDRMNSMINSVVGKQITYKELVA